MQNIIFESPPELVAICILAGFAYAAIQYWRLRHPWSVGMNWLLFALRGILAFFLAFLLLGPIVKQVSNLYERPVFVFLHDNSASVKETVDSATLRSLQTRVFEMRDLMDENGYEASVEDLGGDELADRFSYSANTSDLNGALRRISNRFEGRKIAGVVLISDGLYNSGLSPLYSDYNFPVYTVGIGDTLERPDIAIKNVAYNKIAYQGNKFPIRVEIQAKNLTAQSLPVSLHNGGKVIDRKTVATNGNQLVVVDFQPEADKQGIQKYDVRVEPDAAEQNKRNNNASIFVEIVEGKKKILVVAAAPHPDIKALREVVDKNSNYEFLLHVPDVAEQPANVLRPENVDLAIFVQAPDLRGKTAQTFQTFAASKVSLFFVIGQKTDLPLIARNKMPVQFENAPRDYDEVTPVTNPAFTHFTLSPETNTLMNSYPPVSVHYGKIQIPVSANPLLMQRVGSVATEKPLLAVDVNDSRKIGFMLGEGIWRWRLNEFDRTEKTEAFDEIFGKLIQFLTTNDDKRKFRSYPIQQEFSETEAVVFESQVYNDIFEPVYGNSIEIEITGEDGRKNEYTYVTSPGNNRYQIGGLHEGVYRYRSSTTINGKQESVHGEFAVVERKIELQNVTADFDLLRKVSANTGGRFFEADEVDQLSSQLQQSEATSVIHSEETYDSIINLKWVFWVLLALVTLEWGLRKYHGSY